MEMQRRVGPIIYSSPCDNLSALVVKEVNHENFAAHEEPLLHDRLEELAISWLKTPDPVGTWSCCRPGLRGFRIFIANYIIFEVGYCTTNLCIQRREAAPPASR